jgi:hypothetical protein
VSHARGPSTRYQITSADAFTCHNNGRIESDQQLRSGRYDSVSNICPKNTVSGLLHESSRGHRRIHTGVLHATVVSLYIYELGQNALLDRNSCSSLRERQLALQQQHSVRSLLRKTASSVHVEQNSRGHRRIHTGAPNTAGSSSHILALWQHALVCHNNYRSW